MSVSPALPHEAVDVVDGLFDGSIHVLKHPPDGRGGGIERERVSQKEGGRKEGRRRESNTKSKQIGSPFVNV